MKYDSLYKQFFSSPSAVRDLLLGFVPGDWVSQLDFSTLTRVQNSFSAEQLKQRHSDIIWRVVHNGQQPVFIYLMLEAQSSPDPFMPLRCLVYAGLLLQELVVQKNLKPGQLPPVLPIVIYNGDRPWTEANRLQDLTITVPGLEAFQPQMQVLVLDEKRIPSETLSLNNLLASMISLEQAINMEGIQVVFDRMAERYRSEDNPESRLMLEVFWQATLVIANARHFETKPLPASWKEVREHMSGLKDWIDQQYADGEAKGRAEGEALGTEKGRLFGEITVLEKQLTRKFGPLPAEVRERISSASLEQIEEWALQFVDATSLDAVFQ